MPEEPVIEEKNPTDEATPPEGGGSDPKRDLDKPEDDLYPNESKKDDPNPGEEMPKEGEGEKKGDVKKEDDVKKAPKIDLATVPEDGKYSLNMPEGVEVNTDFLDAISPALKEKGFSHKDAQSLADAYMAQREREQETALDAWDETVSDWGKQTKADKEIGGDKFDANVTLARKTIEKFGNDELTKALDVSGMGSHPEIIRLLVNVGNSITDDDVPNSGSNTSKSATNTSAEAAVELYGETTPSTRR